MSRIINYILSLFFLFLFSGCAYEPILKNKNYQFSVNFEEIVGDEKVNSIIVNNFNNLISKKQIYDLSISSTKEKNIISKDSKGDPAIFELIIKVDYTVKKDEKTLIKNKLNRKSTYNNISDKFELENYEKNIVKNLSTNIYNKIINSISEINDN